jgi:hypothetical protein
MIVASLRGRAQSSGIGTAARLGYGERDATLAGEHRSCDRVEKLRPAELYDRRQADPVRRQVREHDAGAGPVHFFGEEHAIVGVGILGVAAHCLGKANAQQPRPRSGLVQRIRKGPGRLPRGEVRFNFASDEVADPGAPKGVLVGQERRRRTQAVEIQRRQGSRGRLHGTGPI